CRCAYPPAATSTTTQSASRNRANGVRFIRLGSAGASCRALRRHRAAPSSRPPESRCRRPACRGPQSIAAPTRGRSPARCEIAAGRAPPSSRALSATKRRLPVRALLRRQRDLPRTGVARCAQDEFVLELRGVAREQPDERRDETVELRDAFEPKGARGFPLTLVAYRVAADRRRLDIWARHAALEAAGPEI